MSGPGPETHCTPLTTVVWIVAEVELLLISECFTDESNTEEDEANDVHDSPVSEETGGWSIDKHDWKRHSEDPHCLECPERGKLERIRPRVIKPLILSYLDDPVEQVSRQSETPENDAGGESYLSPVVSVGQAHGQDGENYKVGSSSKICHLEYDFFIDTFMLTHQIKYFSYLVKFECAGNNEE